MVHRHSLSRVVHRHAFLEILIRFFEVPPNTGVGKADKKKIPEALPGEDVRGQKLDGALGQI